LLPLVYDELRKLAAQRLVQENPAKPWRPPRKMRGGREALSAAAVE
jgi:hypothetical protein